MTDKAKRLAEWKIIDVQLAASALASIVGSAVADGQVTETLTIPEGTIYRTTHFDGTIPAAVAMVFVPKAEPGHTGH